MTGPRSRAAPSCTPPSGGIAPRIQPTRREEARGRHRVERATRRSRCGPTALTRTCCSRRQRRVLRRRASCSRRGCCRRASARTEGVCGGHWWLLVDLRGAPVHAVLAAVLWRLGRREKVVEHQRDLFRLPPPGRRRR